MVTGPWSEHPLEARQCTYRKLEIETPDDGTQRVLAVAVENNSPGEGPKYNSSSPIVEHYDIDNLVGKLLTYVDATYSDPMQRSAHKDLIRQSVWDWYKHHSKNGEKTIEFAQKFDESR